MGIFSVIFGFLGSAVKSFFGLKQTQVESINKALDTLGEVSTSNGTRETAVATIIASEASSGYWLSACWRPLVSVSLFILIVCYFFGMVPPDVNKPLSPMMGRIFDLFEVCLYGYIPARTIEKIVQQINIGSMIKRYFEKKGG